MASRRQALAGIDIGTSGAKSVLIDQDGNLLAWAGQEYPLDAPYPDWAEQNPQVWLDAAQNTLRQCLQASRLAPDQVAAIGLTGQMHSLVCLDESGAALRPAIIWADRRSRRQVQELTHRFGQQNLAAWTGNPLATGFMLASWAWLCQEEPHTAARTRWLLLPKDEVRYRMTGQIGSEPSDASSTLLFDPHKRSWSQPVLDQVGLSLNRLPAIHESAQVAGGLLPGFARACGLLSGTPVVYGCSDQAAQAFSQGVIQPGLVSCTIGTGGQVLAPLAEPVHDPDLRLHLFCHALPGVWHLELAILSAGLALRWLRDQVWPGSQYNELADAAAGVEAASEGLFFLPYLAGERTPHMDFERARRLCRPEPPAYPGAHGARRHGGRGVCPEAGPGSDAQPGSAVGTPGSLRRRHAPSFMATAPGGYFWPAGLPITIGRGHRTRGGSAGWHWSRHFQGCPGGSDQYCASRPGADAAQAGSSRTLR